MVPITVLRMVPIQRYRQQPTLQIKLFITLVFFHLDTKPYGMLQNQVFFRSAFFLENKNTRLYILGCKIGCLFCKTLIFNVYCRAYGTNGVFNLNWYSACYKNLPRKAPTSAPASFLCFSDRNLPCSNGVKIGIFIWKTKIYKNIDWWIQLFSTIFLYLQ